MKITKLSIIKVLSVITALVLLTVNTVVSFISTAENSGDLGEIYCLPTEQLGYYLGDTATAYPGNDIDIRTSGRLTGDALEAAAPRLSEKGAGYNGSYAMEVGTDEAYYRYLFRYRLEGAMSKLKAVPITIEMKVKMVSGSVKNIYAAQYRSSAPSDYVSPDTYTSDDLSDSEWTTLKFTRTEGTGTSRWMYINIVSGDNGAVLLIDEIRVYLASDPDTNYLIGEYTYLNKTNSVPYTSLPTNVGDFDVTFTKTPTIDFDNTVNPDVEYAAGTVKYYTSTNTSISSTVIPTISAAGDGVKGSYAMELATTDAGAEKLYLQPSSLSAEGMSLRPSTTYNVKLKVRVKSGSVKTFESGIFENGGRGFISAFKVYSVELSEEWQCYSFDVATTDVTNQWRRLAFHYSTGEGGAVIQLDDIEVYKKNGDTLTPIDFGHSSIYNQGIIGSYDIERKSSLSFDNTAYENTDDLLSPEKFGVREFTSDAEPYISEKGEGVKGTYAMCIPVNKDGLNTVTFQSSARQNKETSFYWDTTYTVDFKIRVKSGSLSEFNVGMRETSITLDEELKGVSGGSYIDDPEKNNYQKWYYPQSDNTFYTLSGDDVSSEWKRFSCQVTTNNNTKNWKRLAFYIVADKDTVIQIDDLQVYWMDGDRRVDITYMSHANGNIDVGGTFDEWRASYTTASVDSSPDGTNYYPIYFENWTDRLDDNGNYLTKISDTAPTIYLDGLADKTAQDQYRNKIMPRLEQYSGVKDSYAFVIGDASVPNVFAYETGLRYGKTNQLKDNTEYTFTVKLKKEGTVDRFKIGVRENYNVGTIHYPFQLVNSDMGNEWIEYTFKYTTNSDCTGGWSEIFFSYSSQTGAKIYIDDVHMYVSADAEKNQCFTWADFDYADLGQVEKVVLSDYFPENFEVPYFAPSTNSDRTVIAADPQKGIVGYEGTGNVAEILNYNGNGVLAIGFDNEESNVEYRENLTASKPGGTYNISFKILVQGDNVERCRVGVYNSFGCYEYYNAGADFNQYEHGKWTTVSYTWTDPANYISGKGYRYFVLDFIGGAGSGVMIDDLVITYVSDDWGGEAPNIINYGSYGSYKTEKPNLVWSEIFTYKEEK